ncbi:MAG: hypothetical protein H6705_15885 [Myxococcales bacterium]|nr:hypothetical protein [Myxococcales bacterium]
MKTLPFVSLLLFAPGLAAAASKTVCVDVQVKSWTRDTPDDSAEAEEAAKPKRAADPFAIDPARYLRRMTEYEVTHEVGFEAVEANCTERLTVELYPLRSGWTVFARYSGHAREEKVDHVQLDEFVSLAQRLTSALLRDKPISDVITRENVLRADSQSDLRTIDGEGHFVLGFGTRFRYGQLATVQSDGSAEETGRLVTPLDFHLGYRGKYQAWGLDAFVRGALGVSSQSPRRNTEGGHVDFAGAGAFGLHFLRYFDATGVTSLYWGGGAQFQLNAFTVIQPEGERGGADYEYLYGGGLDVDLILGVEFMRASSVHFFVQLEAQLPTYLFDTEVAAGGVDTWLPGGMLQIGMIF